MQTRESAEARKKAWMNMLEALLGTNLPLIADAGGAAAVSLRLPCPEWDWTGRWRSCILVRLPAATRQRPSSIRRRQPIAGLWCVFVEQAGWDRARNPSWAALPALPLTPGSGVRAGLKARDTAPPYSSVPPPRDRGSGRPVDPGRRNANRRNTEGEQVDHKLPATGTGSGRQA